MRNSSLGLSLFVGVIMIAASCGLKPFVRPAIRGGFSSLRSTTTAANVAAFAEPKVSDQLILDPLPRVYVYDHCPFCVRVRLALGLKKIKHEIHFLANDDIPTPTALVGKKVVPIFERPGSIKPQAESMDIVKMIDSDPVFGKTDVFKPFSGRTDLKEWQNKIAGANRLHQRPRYMMTYLPEFATKDGKNAYVRNHQLEPYTKDEWKATVSNEDRWKMYGEAYEKSLTLIDSTNEVLKELDDMIYSVDYCTEGGLSYDDIDLWSRLRSLTLVKGIVFPPKAKAYLDNLADKSDLPLYFSIAC